MTVGYDYTANEANAGGSQVVRLLHVPDLVPPPLAHLAEAVKTRRRTLGLTRDALRRAGGPSDSTLARIENPESNTAFPRPSTLARLDTALSWAPGSAAGCLDLREPREASGNGAASAEQENLDPPTDPLDFSHVAVPATVIREGLDIVQRLSLSESSDPSILRELRRFAHHLGAAHATEVLERFASAGRSVPEFLLTALGPYLADAGSDIELGVENRQEQDYRRWLAGQTVDDGDRFRSRLHQKIRAIG